MPSHNSVCEPNAAVSIPRGALWMCYIYIYISVQTHPCNPVGPGYFHKIGAVEICSCERRICMQMGLTESEHSPERPVI